MPQWGRVFITNTLTIRDFFKHYPDDNSCVEHVMKVRCGLHYDCPKCERLSHFYRLQKQPAYSCEFSGHHVYPGVKGIRR